MGFLKLAADRWSVREFDARPVGEDKIGPILRAAQLAPTAVNYQPFKVYVLESDQALARIRGVCRSLYGAPVVFLICSDERQTWKSRTEPGYSTGEMDASIVCTHMMLEAWELGLGSCWVRLFSVDEVRRALGLPRHMVPRCLLPVGYIAEDAEPYAPLARRLQAG